MAGSSQPLVIHTRHFQTPDCISSRWSTYSKAIFVILKQADEGGQRTPSVLSSLLGIILSRSSHRNHLLFFGSFIEDDMADYAARKKIQRVCDCDLSDEADNTCRQMLDHMPLGAIIINKEGEILYNNAKIPPRIEACLKGKNFFSLISKTHAKEVQKRFSNNSIKAFDFKISLVRGICAAVTLRGYARQFEGRPALIIFISDNSEKSVLKAVLRKTEKTNAELLTRLKDANNSERIYRAIGESINYGVWVCDPSGRNIYTSPSFLKMVGLNQGDCSNFGWANKLHPEDTKETIECWKECLKSEGILDRVHRYYGIDSQCHQVLSRGAPVRDDQGKIICWAGINLDISEIQKNSQALKESEARFRAAQDASLDCFVIYTPLKDENGKLLDLRIIYANRMMGEHYNTAAEKLIGRLISDVLPIAKEPGGLIERHGHIIKSEKPQEYLLSFDVEGATRYFRNLVVPFKPYVATTFRDVTDMVVGTNALAAAKAAAERVALARSKFLATASHDLRQPVQTLVLLLAMLKSQETSPSFNKVLSMAENALEGLKGLMNSILNISRLDAGLLKPQPVLVTLGELLERLAKEYVFIANDKGLRLRAVSCNKRIHTDPLLLERALRNLIENAIRYTEQGGILLGARKRGNMVHIDIIDTGIGIPPDKQSQIFEEFFQIDSHNKGQGLGLGLSIVGRISALLRAQIQVLSNEGRGSRFSLCLPLDEGAPEQMAVPVDHGTKDKGRLLIIEDNADVRTGMQLLTEGWGFETVAASSGEEALLLCSMDVRFDAIMADHRLGRGLTGTETVNKLREQARRPIPAVIITGDTASEQITEMQAGGFDVMFKPVGAMELRRKLEHLMAQKGEEKS